MAPQFEVLTVTSSLLECGLFSNNNHGSRAQHMHLAIPPRYTHIIITLHLLSLKPSTEWLGNHALNVTKFNNSVENILPSGQGNNSAFERTSNTVQPWPSRWETSAHLQDYPKPITGEWFNWLII